MEFFELETLELELKKSKPHNLEIVEILRYRIVNATITVPVQGRIQEFFIEGVQNKRKVQSVCSVENILQLIISTLSVHMSFSSKL